MSITITLSSGFTIDSYDTLLLALSDWLDRNDLDGVAPQMVGLAEPRINRALNSVFIETSATVSVASGAGVLPSDVGRVVTVVYGTCKLPQCSPSEGVDLTGSTPQKYSIEAGGIRLWPATTSDVTVLYQPILPALSLTNQTNVILDIHPDVYFYGAMMHAEGYLANDARAVRFEALFLETLEEARQWLVRQRFAGPLVPNISVP
jgi:hypothetical protein